MVYANSCTAKPQQVCEKIEPLISNIMIREHLVTPLQRDRNGH
jgi:hypothetical protein